ncbi:gephyrin-like molybdotransferase Glp [Denitratisoma sp. DHT3]|uniref:molybdopterin molybdotransferase MoeA n=1 Tax=Denitratisoma sp. DHT3 TaxID=1981880 RepID=UPI0016479BF1|nr:gephyrin-like molybdotransferase Glp [Denitratisoma sp. DHT3]
MTLLSFDAARAALLASAHPIDDIEWPDLAEAYGRVLAADLTSPLTVPSFDNSAMDGYALRAADVPAPGTRLPVSQRITAGASGEPLAPGSAARIFTGAPLPAGADTVVMQELCEAGDGMVTIQHQPRPGDHVRLAGADIRAGTTILAAGTRLSAAALGLAASVGVERLPLRRRLRVAIFSTGDELRNPGQPLGPGQIYNSNRYVMRGFLQSLGLEVVDLGIVADDRQITRDALLRAAAAADVILASGGMSEGEEDHVAAAVRAEGRLDVWKVAMKPGKPLAFGSVGQTPFIGLPGNPVAVWVGLLLLVEPFLARRQGATEQTASPQRLRADFSWKVKGNRLEFLRVRKNAQGGLDCYLDQSSGVLSSAVWADGLAVIPPGTEVRPGDEVDFIARPAG